MIRYLKLLLFNGALILGFVCWDGRFTSGREDGSGGFLGRWWEGRWKWRFSRKMVLCVVCFRGLLFNK